MKKAVFAALACGVLPFACVPALAVAAPAQDGQWCPGQTWNLEWGVNWDRQHCHGRDNPQENDTDLDGDAPSEYGAPPSLEKESEIGPGPDNSNHNDQGSPGSAHDVGGHQGGGKETGA